MAEEIKKTQSIEKFENNFLTSLDEQKLKLDAFKENARFKVNSQKKLEESKIVLTNIKAMKDNAKFLKETYYKPISDFIKDKIYSPIKSLEDEIKSIEDFHKGEQLSWLRKLREEQERKEKEIEDKLRKEKISLEGAGKKIEKIEQKVEAVRGVTVRMVLKIVDFAKVPDKYKLPNMPLMNREGKEVKIPGTEWVKEETISNR